MMQCECGRNKALLLGEGGERKEICCWCSLTDESKRQLEEIHKKTEKMLKPLYEELGINMDTENLHWTNGEVFVINKKTKERREIGQSQKVLNNKLLGNAMEMAGKCKGDKVIP